MLIYTIYGLYIVRNRLYHGTSYSLFPCIYILQQVNMNRDISITIPKVKQYEEFIQILYTHTLDL